MANESPTAQRPPNAPSPVNAPARKKFLGLGVGGAVAAGAISVLAIAVCSGFTFALLVPALAQTRVAARRTATATRLVSVGEALKVYAAANGGAFPEAGADLRSRLATSGVDPGVFTPPVWFHYVPGRTLGGPETDILLYEDPGATDGSGGRVVYLSLFNTFVVEPSFREMIDGIKLNDGTPWTPHQAGWVPPKR